MALPGITEETVIAAQSGDADAMWDVVSAHDPIIWRIIRQVAAGVSADDADDLLQEGRAELISRIRSYDSGTTAAQLQTYAYSHVRRAIVDAHVRSMFGVTVEMTSVLRVRKALADYEGNAEAAFLALRARYSMERETFTAVMDAMRDVTYLDSPVGDGDEGLTLSDILADESTSVADPVERRALAHHLLAVMAPRQSYALKAFHGIGMMPTPDEDVADHLRTTKANVRKNLRPGGITSARAYATRCGIAA